MPIAAEDGAAVIEFATRNVIDYVVIGPEAPLVAGLADDLAKAGIKAFGPSRAAAMLESSKGFTKDLCAKYDIPTAAYGRFIDPGSAKGFVREAGAPIVVKADGLAAGKGVTIADSPIEAEAAIDAIMVERALRRSRRIGGHRGIPGRRRKPASLPWSTGKMCCRSSPPRTTSAPSTERPDRTPAAWGRTLPRPS